MSNDYLYVIAGRLEHARAFAHAEGVPFNKLIYIFEPEKLRGINKKKLYMLPSAHSRENLREILDHARARLLEIESVEEDYV